MKYMYTIPNHTRNNSPAKLFYLSHSRVGRWLFVFYGAVALFEWNETDIPFIEHAKYFSTCPYNRYVKGHAFICEQHLEYRTELD